jgi:hypothetical protein
MGSSTCESNLAKQMHTRNIFRPANYNIVQYGLISTPGFSGCSADISYNKLVTGGNDPSITKAMRYANLVNNSKNSTVLYKYK